MTRPRKMPSQQRSRFTYDTILEAAARVFNAEGMTATTNRIAERAGVSVGSLYQYFPNKQALALRHIDHAENVFAAAQERIHASRPGLETVVAELVTLAVRENTPLAQAHQVMREHTPRSAEIEHRFRQFLDVVVDGLVTYLDPPEDRAADTRLRVWLAVTALDSQIHHVVLDAATDQERHARTRLLIEQTAGLIRGVEHPPDS